jgi:AcrR family transcriptional regulator
MTEVTRRERIRASTELEIRQHARTLLVRQGRDAVTLRAIARELGITAPALYRYYDSREDLLRRLCDDIRTDLASELDHRLEPIDAEDHRAKVLAACLGFRRWALAHRQEFTLVFATPAGEGGCDHFAGVFLRLVGPLMSEDTAPNPGADVSREELSALLGWWGRLYGQVALEVFGQFPFDDARADRLFDSMLIEFADDIGLVGN